MAGVTLSPFFGQLRGFLIVDSQPACRNHFSLADAEKPLFSEIPKNGFAICLTNGDVGPVHVNPRSPRPTPSLHA